MIPCILTLILLNIPSQWFLNPLLNQAWFGRRFKNHWLLTKVGGTHFKHDMKLQTAMSIYLTNMMTLTLTLSIYIVTAGWVLNEDIVDLEWFSLHNSLLQHNVIVIYFISNTLEYTYHFTSHKLICQHQFHSNIIYFSSWLLSLNPDHNFDDNNSRTVHHLHILNNIQWDIFQTFYYLWSYLNPSLSILN